MCENKAKQFPHCDQILLRAGLNEFGLTKLPNISQKEQKLISRNTVNRFREIILKCTLTLCKMEKLTISRKKKK